MGGGAKHALIAVKLEANPPLTGSLGLVISGGSIACL